MLLSSIKQLKDEQLFYVTSGGMRSLFANDSNLELDKCNVLMLNVIKKVGRSCDIKALLGGIYAVNIHGIRISMR